MPGDPHIPMPDPSPFPSPYPSPVTPPEPSPVPRPNPAPEPAPQPMPVPRPDPAPIPVPSPDPHPAPSPRSLLLAMTMLLAACDLANLGLPGAEPLPRPTPNAAASGFDGPWNGSFSGTAEVGGSTQPISGPITFAADDGVVTVTRPSDGAGTIAPSGATTFSGSMTVAGLPVICTFTGTLRLQGGMAPGDCRCTSLAGSARGTWTAART